MAYLDIVLEGVADCWLEFDFRVIGDGRSATARYANNSNYRNDSLIRKESRSTRSLTSADSDVCAQCV
jgi:hypothetical protein